MRLLLKKTGFWNFMVLVRMVVGLFIMILVANVVLGIVSGILAGNRAKKEAMVWSDVRTVAASLSTYYAANRRYPPDFQLLFDPADGSPPYLAGRMFENTDYRWQYRLTDEGYTFRMVPPGEGMHFYVDQTSVIRAQDNAPADAGSPEWKT